METWEQKIRSNYYQTYRTMRKEFEDDSRDVRQKDAQYRQDVKDGKISKAQYFAWRVRVNLALQSEVKSLAQVLDKADEEALSILNKALPKRYEKAYNEEGYEVESTLDIDTDFEIVNIDAAQEAIHGKFTARYDKAANDRSNRRKISSVITASVLQGSSIDDIAGWLLPLCENNRKTAVRNARTWMNGVQNGGRHAAALRMSELGVQEEKIWLAVTDMRTRFSHRALDEERKKINEPFSNGGMYPADPSLPPEERYNCRCRYRIIPEGFNPDMNIRHVDIGGMSYDEWKQGKIKQKKVQTKAPAQTKPSKPTGYQLDAEGKKAYNGVKSWLSNDGVSQRNVDEWDSATVNAMKADTSSIWKRLCGGDQTGGSCASLALAFAANKAGLNILDYRGGKSRDCFCRDINIERTLKAAGASYQKIQVTREAKDTANILSGIDMNKEYLLTTGRHAAIVRNYNGELQYLEMQASHNNGWKPFEPDVDYYDYKKNVWATKKVKAADTLHNRFGCAKSQRKFYGMAVKSNVLLAEVDSFHLTDEFKDLMSYINTEKSKQKKGASGGTK